MSRHKDSTAVTVRGNVVDAPCTTPDGGASFVVAVEARGALQSRPVIFVRVRVREHTASEVMGLAKGARVVIVGYLVAAGADRTVDATMAAAEVGRSL